MLSSEDTYTGKEKETSEQIELAHESKLILRLDFENDILVTIKDIKSKIKVVNALRQSINESDYDNDKPEIFMRQLYSNIYRIQGDNTKTALLESVELRDNFRNAANFILHRISEFNKLTKEEMLEFINSYGI